MKHKFIRANGSQVEVDKMGYKYLEIRSYGDGGVVKRIDVTGKSERQIERIESGMNRNLNHDKYYTTEFESKVELEKI